VIFVLLVCLTGVLYFHFRLGEDWIESIYNVAITVSTIGYETPRNFSGPVDMLFITALILLGVSSGAYTVSLLVSHIVEGSLADILEQRKMNKQIAMLEGHTIVCGIGRIGSLIAKDLLEQGLTAVLVDKSEEILAEFRKDGFLVLAGDASEEQVLKDAGIDRAATLVSAVPSDAESVYLTLTARFLNRKIRIVARGTDEACGRKLKRAGATAVILPNIIGGRRMAQAVFLPNVMDFVDLTLGKGKHSLRLDEVRIQDSSKYAGKTLLESGLRQEYGLIVVSVKKSNGKMAFNPSGNTLLDAGDILIALGEVEMLERLKRAI